MLAPGPWPQDCCSRPDPAEALPELCAGGGTLIVGGPGALGTGPLTMYANTALDLSTSGTYSNNITAGIGSTIEWDVEKMQCTNKPELNKFVRREYRSGWEVC